MKNYNNQNVLLELDFNGLKPSKYKILKKIMVERFRLQESSATVYFGDAGTVRNAISKLNEEAWFRKKVRLARLFIDGNSYDIIDKLDRFDVLYIYLGRFNKRERLKQLVS